MAPRWLNDDEQQTWRSYLAMTRMVSESLDAQLQRDAGMPLTYYVILAMLSEAPNRTLRMNELAVVAGTSQSRLSHAVGRMEESGWIRREQCSTDKRGYFAVLTPEGYEKLQSAAPGHVQNVRAKLFDPLSPEQVEHLRSITETVLKADQKK